MRKLYQYLTSSSPIDIRQQDIKIEVACGECDGIAVNGELIFCQVYDPWPKCLYRVIGEG
jgi:hypothetical protein